MFELHQVQRLITESEPLEAFEIDDYASFKIDDAEPRSPESLEPKGE